MSHQRKILFVDDEPNIRLTLPTILQMHGYEVTSTGSVAEALAAMQSDRFDVLIADLNIGQPGDGFTIVSAMRRTQPHAVTLILTGYPAFETALEAIRSQVDDYLVKPADISHLIGVIERNLVNHTPVTHLIPKALSKVLRDHKDEICDRWFAAATQDPHMKAHGLSREELVNHIPPLVEELTRMLDGTQPRMSEEARDAAFEHGRLRKDQGFCTADLVNENRILRQTILRIVQENLLAVNTSYVISDIMAISECLDQITQASVEGFEQDAEVAA